MRCIEAQEIFETLYLAIPKLACGLPADVERALMHAYEQESSGLAREVLLQLCENAHLARSRKTPLCQDTGTVWACLEFGPDCMLSGDVFALANEAVAQAYTDAHLRKSVVRDALFDRQNTQDNTPAFCELSPSTKPGARLHVMLKGGGSDNASRVCMLEPQASRQGVIDTVCACVHEKAANACPPLIVGVGVGSTYDKVASLAKKALMRPLDEQVCADDPEAQQRLEFEQELLEAINASGIGPGALGGISTALAVKLETASCHIAALPVAVNMGCCAMRRESFELSGREM